MILAACELEDQRGADQLDVAPLQPPDYEERVLFLGTNGTGKTRLEEELLWAGNYPRWTVVDWKGDFQPIGPHVRTERPPWDDRRSWSQDRVLYQPRTQWDRAAGSIDQVLLWVFAQAQDAYDRKRRRSRRPRVLVVTEAYRLSRTRHIQGLSDCAVSGRALDLGLWLDSQRPVWLPVETRTEAWRWFLFYLSKGKDREEVLDYFSDALTLDDIERAKEQYSFHEVRRTVTDGYLEVVARHCQKVRLSPRAA